VWLYWIVGTVISKEAKESKRKQSNGHVEWAIIPLRTDEKELEACPLIIIPTADDFFPATVQKDCLPLKLALYLKFEDGLNSNLHAPTGLCKNP
jgi:hypothetical protein